MLSWTLPLKEAGERSVIKRPGRLKPVPIKAVIEKVMQSLKELTEKLPPELRQEVRDFVEFLLERRVARRPKRKPRFEWAGALKDLRDRYTSVELQHKIVEWRIGER